MHFVWRLAILLMVGLAPSVPFAREALPRSVLYLDENDPSLPFAQGISAAFRAALNAGSAERIAVYSENLDLVRSSGPRYEEILKTYLREKYRDRPIGVIATIGPAALTFMLRARPELWAGCPRHLRVGRSGDRGASANSRWGDWIGAAADRARLGERCARADAQP